MAIKEKIQGLYAQVENKQCSHKGIEKSCQSCKDYQAQTEELRRLLRLQQIMRKKSKEAC